MSASQAEEAGPTPVSCSKKSTTIRTESWCFLQYQQEKYMAFGKAIKFRRLAKKYSDDWHLVGKIDNKEIDFIFNQLQLTHLFAVHYVWLRSRYDKKSPFISLPSASALIRPMHAPLRTPTAQALLRRSAKPYPPGKSGLNEAVHMPFPLLPTPAPYSSRG